jgi:hypothetical protein
MSQGNITLMPSDIVGAIAHGLQQAASYLASTPAMSINTNETKAHLGRLVGFLDELDAMQESYAKAAADAAADNDQLGVGGMIKALA